MIASAILAQALSLSLSFQSPGPVVTVTAQHDTGQNVEWIVLKCAVPYQCVKGEYETTGPRTVAFALDAPLFVVYAAIPQTMARVEVTQPAGVIACPETVGRGEAFNVSVFGGSSANDWLGLYDPGAPLTPYPQWTYVGLPRPAVATFTAPEAQGVKEARLYADNGSTLLGACLVEVR